MLIARITKDHKTCVSRSSNRPYQPDKSNSHDCCWCKICVTELSEYKALKKMKKKFKSILSIGGLLKCY